MQDAQTSASPLQSAAPTPNASLTDRFFALLIDSFFLAVLLWVATHAFGTVQITSPGLTSQPPGALFNPATVSGGYSSSASNGPSYPIAWTIMLTPLWQGIIVFLYFTLQEAFFGQTLGKRFMHLRVVTQLDETTYVKLTPQAAIVRNLLRFIDAIGMYLLGWIVALASPRRRRLGDMVACTLVVKEGAVLAIRPPRKQRVLGLQVMAALVLVFLLGCALFTYFGRPPLVVQNVTITRPEIFNNHPGGIHISSYNLGQATWGEDNGQTTITYPITYTAIYQNTDTLTNQTTNRMHACQGSITLKWYWSSFDWELASTGESCRDV